MASIAARSRKPAGRMSLAKNVRRYWVLYLMLVIPLAYAVIFCYVPMYGLTLAFKDYDPIEGFYGGEYVGFENFIRFFESYDFADIIINTVSISLYYMVVNFFAPVILAIAINEAQSRLFKKTVQMVTYAPYFISTIVLVAMMFQVFSTRIGIVSKAVELFGGTVQNYLGEPKYFRHLFVWSGIWQNVGYSSVIYIAALTAIDPQQHEAATVDGANRLQKIWYIDIPSIMPTMVVLLIMSAGRVMNVGFEKTYLMQNPMNISVSEVISTYVYKVGLINTDFSFSTAVGMFNSVINLALIVVVNFLAQRLGESSLW